jgi:hypothetical protein
MPPSSFLGSRPDHAGRQEPDQVLQLVLQPLRIPGPARSVRFQRDLAGQLAADLPVPAPLATQAQLEALQRLLVVLQLRPQRREQMDDLVRLELETTSDERRRALPRNGKRIEQEIAALQGHIRVLSSRPAPNPDSNGSFRASQSA